MKDETGDCWIQEYAWPFTTPEMHCGEWQTRKEVE
jgi:hypothetical protein